MVAFSLSGWESLGAGTGLYIAFVGSMYLPKAARQDNYQRDKKENIRDRLLSASSVCALGVWVVSAVVPQDGAAAAAEVSLAERLGLLHPVAGAAAGLVATSLLFLGVIRQRYEDDGVSELRNTCRALWRGGDEGYVTARNLVWAPVLEEVLYRSCFVYLMRAGGWGTEATVCSGIALFALSHVHHAFHYVRSLGFSTTRAIGVVAANFVVHSIFGGLSMALYLSTASVWTPVVSHMMCNFLGAPSLGFLTDESYTTSVRRQISLCHVGGIAGFAYTLKQLPQWF